MSDKKNTYNMKKSSAKALLRPPGFLRPGLGAIVLAVMLAIGTSAAYAAEVPPSVTEVKIPLVISASSAVAGAEIAFTQSSGLGYLRFEPASGTDNPVHAEAKGKTWVGFFSATNKYQPSNGSLSFGNLVFRYEGNAAEKITIEETRLHSLANADGDVDSLRAYPNTVIPVTRASTGNVGGGGSVAPPVQIDTGKDKGGTNATDNPTVTGGTGSVKKGSGTKATDSLAKAKSGSSGSSSSSNTGSSGNTGAAGGSSAGSTAGVSTVQTGGAANTGSKVASGDMTQTSQMVPFSPGEDNTDDIGNILDAGDTPLAESAGASDGSGSAEWRLPLLLAAVCAAALLLFIYARRRKKEGQESESGESKA